MLGVNEPAEKERSTICWTVDTFRVTRKKRQRCQKESSFEILVVGSKIYNFLSSHFTSTSTKKLNASRNFRAPAKP